MGTSLFSDPQPTLAAAIALHIDALFNPAAVFQAPLGYVYCRLRSQDGGRPTAAAETVKAALGYTLAAWCDPLLGVWRMEAR